jgi:transposase
MFQGVKRRRFTAREKAKVALEALREQRTVAQIASAYGCHGNQVGKWKKEAINGLTSIFETGQGERSEEKLMSSLYEQIGRLEMEVEWFKKKLGTLP